MVRAIATAAEIDDSASACMAACAAIEPSEVDLAEAMTFDSALAHPAEDGEVAGDVATGEDGDNEATSEAADDESASNDHTPLESEPSATEPSAAEQEYQVELSSAEAEYAAAGLAVAECKAALKSAKTAFKEIEDRLIELKNRGPRRIASERSSASGGMGESGGGIGAANGSNSSGDCGPDARWRSFAIADMLELPAGMRKSLTEENGIATLGELSDRINAANGGKPDLKKIGPAKWEKLRDEYLLAFWARHPTLIREAAYGEGGGITGGVGDNNGNGSSSGNGDGRSSGGFTPEELAFRAADLERTDFTSPALDDHRFYESGREAFDRDCTPEDCPYVTMAERDDWLRGLLSARAMADEGGEEGGDDTDTDDEAMADNGECDGEEE